MSISVHFLGFQRALAKVERVKVPLIADMCVADVLNFITEQFPQLSLRENEVFAMVNDQVCMNDRILQSNDTVSFFPHIGGG